MIIKLTQDLSIGAGLQAQYLKATLTKMVDVASKLASGLTGMKLEAFAASMGQFAVAAAFQLTQVALDLAFAIDDAGKKFQATTGYTKDFTGSIKNVSVSLIDTGVSVENVSSAFGALSSNLTKSLCHIPIITVHYL